MATEANGPHLYTDLLREVEVPPNGTMSRTLHNDDGVKVVLFGFSKGQELSEHTASMPAVLHVLSGEASLTLGDEQHEVGPGAWVRMPANLPHSVLAKSDLVMLLTLIKRSKIG